MRILHLVKTTRGATWALRQMRELVKLGADVHVVLPSCSGNAPDYSASGITVHPVDLDLFLKSLVTFPRQVHKFNAVLKKIRPDLVHSHFYSTTLLMRLAMRHNCIPKLFQVPGPLHLEHGFFRTVEMGLADRHDFWIASCEWTQKKIPVITGR
jgi:hypothetical protein